MKKVLLVTVAIVCFLIYQFPNEFNGLIRGNTQLSTQIQTTQVQPTLVVDQSQCGDIDWGYLRSIYFMGMETKTIPNIQGVALDDIARKVYTMTGLAGDTQMLPMAQDFTYMRNSNLTETQVVKFLTDYLAKVNKSRQLCSL